MSILFPYVCILDFEATCEKDVKYFDNEIIEFPSVLLEYNYDLQNPSYKNINEFQQYCRPLLKPVVSKFCFELTGITQKIVDNGNNFPTVLEKHHNWLRNATPDINIDDNINVIIITCGHWDLGTVMINECKKWNLIPPKIYCQYINIKDIFDDFYKAKSEGMANMLNFLNIVLEGRHHSGLDDCKNIAKIFQRIIVDGYIIDKIFIITIDPKMYKIAHKNSKKELENNEKRIARLANR